jgi:hypothetical protein
MSRARAVGLIVGACVGLNVWLGFLALTRSHPVASVVFTLYLTATIVVLIGLTITARRRFSFDTASSLALALRCGSCGDATVYRDFPRGPFEQMVLPLLMLHPHSCLRCRFRAYLRT